MHDSKLNIWVFGLMIGQNKQYEDVTLRLKSYTGLFFLPLSSHYPPQQPVFIHEATSHHYRFGLAQALVVRWDDLHGVALVLHQVNVSRPQLRDPPLQLLDPGVFQGRGHHHEERPLPPEGARHRDGLHRLPKTHLDRANQHTENGREKQVNCAQTLR